MRLPGRHLVAHRRHPRHHHRRPPLEEIALAADIERHHVRKSKNPDAIGQLVEGGERGASCGFW